MNFAWVGQVPAKILTTPVTAAPVEPVSPGISTPPPPAGPPRLRAPQWTGPTGEMPAASPRHRRVIRLLLPLVILALLATVYANSLSNPFAVEDHAPLLINPEVMSPGGWTRLWMGEFFGHSVADQRLYRPVTAFSLHFNAMLAGFAPNPVPFRLVNLLLLWGVGCAVAGWLMGYVRPSVAWLAGLLIVAHPVNLDLINTIIGRAQLLAILGIVGFLLFQRLALQRGHWRWHEAGLALLAGVVAVGSSETGLLIVPLSLLQPYVLPGKTAGGTMAETRATRRASGHPAWISVLLMLLPVLTYIALRTWITGWVPPAPSPETDLTGNPLRALSFAHRLPASLSLAWIYARELFTLGTTSSHQPAMIATWNAGSAVVGGLMVLGVTTLFIVFLRSRHWLSLALGLALGQFLLVSHLVTPSAVYASNRLMLPFVLGVGMVVAAGVDQWVAKSARRRAVTLVPVTVLLLAMMVITIVGNASRRSELQRWGADYQRDPWNPVAWCHYAQCLADTGESRNLSRARDLFEKLTDRVPQSIEAKMRLGAVYTRLGDNDQAAREYRRVLELDQENLEAKQHLKAINRG